MKKVLSFVLVLAMILGSVSMAFAAPFVAGQTVSEKNTVLPFADAEANRVTTILKDIGAINGDNNGNCKPADELTRAEAAVLIVRALGLDDQGKVPCATQFADVTAAHWASGYVKVAADQGFVGGYAGNFRPDDKMSKDDVVAIFLKVLGFSDEHLKGAYPANYRDMAVNQALLTDLDYGTENATRMDMFQMLYNCLDRAQVEWNENLVITGGTAVAGSYQPVVNAVTLYTKITGKAPVAGTYTTSGPITLTADNVTFANGFDAAEYYGQRVEILRKNNLPIGINKVSSKEITGKFDATATTFTAIDGTAYSFAGGVKVYTVGGVQYLNNAATDKTSGTDIATNKAVTYTLNVKLNRDKKTQIDEVYSQISWSKNGVVVVNATQAAAFASATVTKAAAALKDVDTKYVIATTNEGLALNNIILEGVDKLADIKEDAVVEIYHNGTNATKYVVTQGANPVKGTPEKWASDLSNITVAGKTYSYASTSVAGFNDAAKPDKASEYAFYLDSTGKVVFAKAVVEAKVYNWQYAFLADKDNYKKTVAGGAFADSELSQAAVKVVMPGAKEVTQYDSIKGISGSAVQGVLDMFSLGDLIEIDVKDGVLTTLRAVSLGSTVTASVKNGLLAGAKVTADTKIFQTSVAGVVSEAGYYKELALADVEGKTWTSNAKYVLDTNGTAVKVVVVNGKADADVTTSIITVAAIASQETTADGKTTTITLADGTKYVTTKGAVVVATKTDLFEITLDASGKVDSISAPNAANFNSIKLVSNKALDLELYSKDTDYVALSSAALGASTSEVNGSSANVDAKINVKGITIYVSDSQATDKKYVVATDVEQALSEAKTIIFIDVDKDGNYEVAYTIK